MRIVVALDSFKGSVGSLEAGRALASGLKKVRPAAEVTVVPVADGGEGTLEAIKTFCGGIEITEKVSDPLGRECTASFLFLQEAKQAVVELAQASGLPLLAPEERNPLLTTTYGTGQLVRRAIECGARRILLAVGGSATNDGGTGIAAALGVRFLDGTGAEVRPAGAQLEKIQAIDTGSVPPSVWEVRIEVATDVNNPLCGPQGAARVYAPQKGADPQEVERLDRGLGHLASVLARYRNVSVRHLPGSGAAGGVAACLVALFGARIVNGFEAVADAVDLAGRLRGASVAITGEGKLDAQSLKGKVPLGVARRARAAGVPVFAVGGSIEYEAEALVGEGVVGFFPIVTGPMPLSEAMSRARDLLAATGRRIGYLLNWCSQP